MEQLVLTMFGTCSVPIGLPIICAAKTGLGL